MFKFKKLSSLAFITSSLFVLTSSSCFSMNSPEPKHQNRIKENKDKNTTQKFQRTASEKNLSRITKEDVIIAIKKITGHKNELSYATDFVRSTDAEYIYINVETGEIIHDGTFIYKSNKLFSSTYTIKEGVAQESFGFGVEINSEHEVILTTDKTKEIFEKTEKTEEDIKVLKKNTIKAKKIKNLSAAKKNDLLKADEFQKYLSDLVEKIQKQLGTDKKFAHELHPLTDIKIKEIILEYLLEGLADKLKNDGSIKENQQIGSYTFFNSIKSRLTHFGDTAIGFLHIYARLMNLAPQFKFKQEHKGFYKLLKSNLENFKNKNDIENGIFNYISVIEKHHPKIENNDGKEDIDEKHKKNNHPTIDIMEKDDKKISLFKANENDEHSDKIIDTAKDRNDEGPKIVVSFDGGGVRGIIAAALMNELEKAVNKKLNKEHHKEKPVPIALMVDLFAGTSTGSLLAIGLNFKIKDEHDPRYSAQDMLGKYKELAQKVFPIDREGILLGNLDWIYSALSQLWSSKFSEKGLTEELKGLIGEGATLRENTFSPMLITSYNLTRQQFQKHTTRYAEKFGINEKLIEVARASTAAPTYLKGIKLKETKEVHIDGGMGANDPSLQAYTEIKTLYPKTKKIILISIGTGKEFHKTVLNESETLGVINNISPIGGVVITSLFNSQLQITESVLHFLLNVKGEGQYFRFNPTLTEKIDLGDSKTETMEKLEKMGVDLAKGKEFEKVVNLIVDAYKIKKDTRN